MIGVDYTDSICYSQLANRDSNIYTLFFSYRIIRAVYLELVPNSVSVNLSYV